MPRNGSGQYNPLTNTWNPPVTGVLATGADFQAQLNDISAAITQSVSKDGQTPMTANLPMGNNSIVGIASGTETSPSISANGDTNTGLYFPAADTVGVAVGGVNVGNFTSAGFSGNAATSTNATNLVNGNATLAAGTAAAPSLTTTGDSNTGLYFPAADTVAIATGGVKRVEVDASGNVGVGVTPSAWGSSYKAIDITPQSAVFGASGALYFSNNVYFNSSSQGVYKTTAAAQYMGVGPSGGFTWNLAPSGTAGNPVTFTQAMTLTSDGNLLVGTTSLAGLGVTVQPVGTLIQNNNAQASGFVFASFRRSGTEIGFIDQNGTTAVRYSTTSDYRLKENVQPMTGALAKVAALKPVTYKWKADGTEGQGFIAHELQAVVPDAVTGEKDAVNADGSIRPQGIDTSFLVATLTAAIKEQQALIESQKTAIESLTARIAALEAK